MKRRFPCPSCGYLVFSGPPGTEERCPICAWEDDLMQLRFPLWNARPNGVSLADAQLNFAMVGAKDPQSIGSVRFPGSGDERDPDWRPLDLDVDDPASPPPDFDGLVEPDDPTTLYYWRP